MRITTIPHIYRNVRRWTEILAVLSRYGLADWLSGFQIEFIKDRIKNPAGDVLARLTREARIRLALTDLGPTFIKLGQLLSTRPDIVGKELAAELAQLQADVPADPPEQVRASVEAELGEKIENLFSSFHDTPIASASIGQVHLATLLTGERVVVKVQHQAIERKVQEDLEVLAGLALLAEQFPELANYRPSATLAELGRMLRRELDFGREERNLEQFAAMFKDEPSVVIPKPYREVSTSRILTMDLIEGTSIAHPAKLEAEGIDLGEVARKGAELYLQMIFVHGFFHADPHPGNILALPGNVIGLLDFGTVGRIDEQLREDIEDILIAIVGKDVPVLTNLVKRIGHAPIDLDDGALSADIADFVGHYGNQSLEAFDLRGALTDITEIIRRYRIMLPSQVAMLIKALVTLEGSGKQLSPKFSLIELMQPFQKQMLLKKFSPTRRLRKIQRMAGEYERLAEIFPRRVSEILEQIQAGRFDVHLDHRGLGPSVNRLVLGMLASALFLGSSWLLANKVSPLLLPGEGLWEVKDVSLLGLAGCVTSILIGLRLLRAIGKSGHLDQQG